MRDCDVLWQFFLFCLLFNAEYWFSFFFLLMISGFDMIKLNWIGGEIDSTLCLGESFFFHVKGLKEKFIRLILNEIIIGIQI